MILDHAELPLTSNDAERALHHWVIARRIGTVTHTDPGSHAFVLLASVIDTSYKRNVSPWPYLDEILRKRRRRLPAPAPPPPRPAA